MMSQDEARMKVERGGSVLCLGVPPKTEMQCDLHGWSAGPKFKGIKMIPPGIHFITWSGGQDHVGLFVSLQIGGVDVWRWNAELEDLEPVSGDEKDRLTQGVKEFYFDSEMGAYPQDKSAGWGRLSYLITERVLSTCGIPCGTKVSPVAADSVDIEKFPDAPRPASFSSLARIRRKEGMSAAQISRYNLDGSQKVMELVQDRYIGDWKGLLGEMQLAFILFVFLSSLDSFEHWKQMVALYCTCSDAMETNVEMMAEFVRMLRRQLEHVPTDFFMEELSAENFLRPSLMSLMETSGGDAPVTTDSRQLLRRRVQKLRAFAEERFGLQFPQASCPGSVMASLSIEQEDEAPIVIQVPESAPLPANPHSAHSSELHAAPQFDVTADSTPMEQDEAPVMQARPAVERMSWMLPPEPQQSQA